MNKIWFLMIISSLSLLLIQTPSAVLDTMLSASANSFSLIIELCGIYAVWLGLLELIEQSGLSEKLAKILHPIIKKLFKTNNPEIEKTISMCISANMLGLGNASTPLSIKAVNQLDDKSGTATPAIIMLIVISSTSIQLLPTTIIGLRASAGSSNPNDIIIPTLLSTIITTGIGILLTLLMSKKKRKKIK